jgi:hypothetical protein
MRHLQPGDKAVFALRDPVSRFISGFYSRQRRGEPRYHIDWSPAEQNMYEWFDSPQDLANALAAPFGERRRRAIFAMRTLVRRPMTYWAGRPPYLVKHIGDVLHIARQETLDEDWERLKELLDLPRDQMLPDDELIAHRTTYSGEGTIKRKGVRALRRWYAFDYLLLEIAEDFRRGNHPQPRSRASLALARFRRIAAGATSPRSPVH